MPAVQSNGLTIAYRVSGEGETLVLIRGYANSGAFWYDQVPYLAGHFRVATIDNRGTGQSSVPETRYSIGDMARDVISVVDALGSKPAHLLGISMGGMIAMQAALDAPDAVRSLILGCTTCSGRRGFTSDPAVIEQFATLPDLSDEENIRRSVPVLFAQRTIREKPEVIERYVRTSLEHRAPASTFVLQQKAIARFDICDRLAEISQPTLILHAEGDRLILEDMAHFLDAGIPNSRLDIVPELGHLFCMEDPDGFNGKVVAFIRSLNG